MPVTEQQITEWGDSAKPIDTTKIASKDRTYRFARHAFELADIAQTAIPALIADLREARETISKLTAQAEAHSLLAGIQERREERNARLGINQLPTVSELCSQDAKRYQEARRQGIYKRTGDISGGVELYFDRADEFIDAAIAAQEKP